MKSLYEVLNVDLAQSFTKKRKLAQIDSMGSVLRASGIYDQAIKEVNAMNIPEDDEKYHWVRVVANKAAVDLITIGKVQPENMLLMAGLPDGDFTEAVKIATSFAKSLNDATIAAENENITETLPDEMV